MFSNASADPITHKPNKPCISLESFIFLLSVSLAEYNGVLRVLFPLLQVTVGYIELNFVCGNLLVDLEMIPSCYDRGVYL